MPSSLDSFPLAWRWAELSPDARAQIQPLSEEQALEAHARAERLWQPRGPIPRWENIEFADIPRSTATEWLQQRVPAAKAPVLVSWDQRTAVRVPQSLLVERWQDCLYPSSDDAFVFPPDEGWMLVYRHWEQFEFGVAAV